MRSILRPLIGIPLRQRFKIVWTSSASLPYFVGRIALHRLYPTMRANLYREPKFCGSSSATCACGSHKISLYELPTKLLMQPMIHEYAIAFNAKVTMIDMCPQSSRVLVRRRRRSENTKLPSFALLSALCPSCVQARHSGSTNSHTGQRLGFGSDQL